MMHPSTSHQGEPMRTTTVIMLAAMCTASLTACGSSDTPAPAKTTAPAAATSTAPSKAQLVADCADVIAAGGDSDSEECADLSLDDYYDALQQANEQGRDELQDQLDEAS